MMSDDSLPMDGSDAHGGHGVQTSATRVFTGRLRRVRDGRRWTFKEQAPEPTAAKPSRRPARVAQMLALAHRLQAALDHDEYKDQAELSRHLGLSEARVTQLLDLTLLAPDIQEGIVFLEALGGVEPNSEHALRAIVRLRQWCEQRHVWRG